MLRRLIRQKVIHQENRCKDVIKVFDFFGEDVQRMKLLEECHEYIEAMSFGNHTDLTDSEIADLFLVSLQFFLKKPSVQRHVKSKLRRVTERISDGYYSRNPAYRDMTNS